MKYLAAATLFASAGFIAANGYGGWGWFLFVGVLIL